MDSALYDGLIKSALLRQPDAKLIGSARATVPKRCASAAAALGEADRAPLDGVDTTIPLFHALLDEQDVADRGRYNIHWLEALA